MPFVLPDGALPALLELSRAEQQALADHARCVVRTTIEAGEALAENEAQLQNSRMWKLVKAKEQFQVFRQRRTRPVAKSFDQKTSTTDSNTQSASLEAPEDDASQPRDDLPMMIGHGSVIGTLDDVMFGAFAADDETWRLKSCYVNDRFDGARILATIEGPTREDPYRFLGVKWFTNEYPMGVSALMQRRDFLIVEATGLAKDSKGETVGYSLYQSVEIPQIPELKELKIIRGYSSVCFINRQLTDSTVGIFSRGFLDARGRLPSSFAISLIASSITSSVNVVECAYMKKLTWLIAQQNRDSKIRAHANSNLDHCQACQKQLKRLSTLLSASASTCRVCQELVCSRCSVTKNVVIDTSTQCALRKPFVFCVRCLVTAKNLPAREVAILSLSSPVTISSCSLASP